VIAYRLSWDSRCADCRALLRSGSTGYRVQNRLLCQQCSADVEWTEAEVANYTRTNGRHRVAERKIAHRPHLC
jgi:hypothetical protein